MKQIVRFAITGSIGFCVDVGVLALALSVGLGYFVGRFISFLIAVWTTWRLNRYFTFPIAARPLWHEWWRYCIAMSAGGVINYGVYSVVVLELRHNALLPIYAVAAGSVAGMVVNFIMAKWWVFK